jgi:hypothetical protein
MGVATALSVTGLIVGAATSAASFGQAAKAKKDQRAAEMKAEEAMSEARKKLDVNFYESLSVKKEPYELEREALLASGAQAIEAGVESERGAAAVAGRVQMAQNEQQGAIRTSMGKELTDLEKLTATEEGRLRDINVQLDLEEVAGAQQAAAASQEQYAKSIESGIAGVSSVAQDALQQVPLYLKQGGNGKQKQINMASVGDLSNMGNLAPAFNSNKIEVNPLSSNDIYGYPIEERKKGGVMVVDGDGDDDIALVDTITGEDTGKRVSKGEMIVVSKENVGAIKKAIKAKDKDAVFKVVEAQLKAKPIKKKSVKK